MWGTHGKPEIPKPFHLEKGPCAVVRSPPKMGLTARPLKHMSEVPTPQDTGSTGSQEASAGELVRVNKESPLKGLPIAQRIEGLAATHSRSMGGDLSAILIAGSFAQLSADLQSTKQELTDIREQLRQSQTDLSKANMKCAVFEDRERKEPQHRHLKNFCIFAGTTILGIGIEVSRGGSDKIGYITCAIGILLLVFGWIPPRGRPTQ